MAEQDLKDIHVSRAPNPKRMSLFTISIISLLAMVGIVFVLNKSKAPDKNPTTVINNDPSSVADQTSISGWSTYNAGDVTFNYPSDYNVKEDEKGLYIISNSNESDISVDKRKLGNSNFDTAVSAVRNNLNDQAQKQIPNGIKMFGVIKDGNGKDDPELSAIIKYGDGSLIIKASGDEINEAVFDQIVASLNFKQ